MIQEKHALEYVDDDYSAIDVHFTFMIAPESSRLLFAGKPGVP